MNDLLNSLAYMVEPMPMLYCIIGVVAGVIVGAIPGLGGGMLMALVLPATFAMDNLLAQVLLIGIYVGGVTGGLSSAVLIGVPGTPAAVMTAIDGNAMARKGFAARALSIGIMASLFGGIVSWLVLAGLSAPLARLASQLQSFDYFVFIALGLILIAFAGQESVLKSLISGALGISLALVGFDSISATNRFTFGVPSLSNGFDLLAVLIGAFAVRQMLVDSSDERPVVQQASARLPEILHELGRPFRHFGNLIRSSLIGTVIGLMPGIGANIGAIVAYSAAKGLSKNREEFGHGSEEALVASESGNNATVGGALVPMIALGIPGSGQDVLLMAALILHQIQPGPLLVSEHPEVFYGIISTYLVANIVTLFVMVLSVRYLRSVLSVPKYLLVPLVLMMCTVGVISTNNRVEDTAIMFAFGVLGLFMSWFRFPLAPFVIGFILAPLAEERLRTAAGTARGNWLELLMTPVPLAAIAILIAIGLTYLIGRKHFRTEVGRQPKKP
ncbi:tripartite tricarboxylate transporter permease [Pararhizobium sp. IMCC21322]|uniref:tripartite tricarboxylate transporter permease n=1 Tax=Pararhizobium sp. IMCC21322 TaxID=3067903 RepID=UPI0027407878|nr:tripartite tricarboxylate transporter permease [Pararhizobium sp. IMCC21322]